MARYRGPKEKIDRRIGQRLFLKGERSNSPKSAVVRRPYPPGQHGKNTRGKLSEFGTQLRSKQKIKNIYRLMEKQFKKYIKEAIETKAETGEAIVRNLEQRLDNIIDRMGLAQSRDQARQLVTHGHIWVNGKRVNVPSYTVRQSDEVGVREGSQKSKYFTTVIPAWFTKYESPDWLKVDRTKMAAKLNRLPNFIDSGLELKDIQSIIEFYSR